MKKVYFMAITIISLLFTGCNDKNDASAGNFQKILQDYHGNEEQCYSYYTSSFSYPYELKEKKRHGGGITYGFNSRLRYDKLALDSLVKLGFLKSNKDNSSVIATYELTEKGKENSYAYTNGGDTTFHKFCAAYYEVISVDDFTPPVVQNGSTISKVNYTLQRKLSSWMEDAMNNKEFIAWAKKSGAFRLLLKKQKKITTLSYKKVLELSGLKGWKLQDRY